MPSAALKLSEDQVLAFRARRSHLLGAGAASAEAASQASVGIQAQVLGPALWSLALRTKGRPSAHDLELELVQSPELVRTWGQRDTVHILSARAHWPLIVELLKTAPFGPRGGRQLDEKVIAQAASKIASLGRPVVRSDLFGLIPNDFLEYMASRTGPGVAAQRGAAGRMVWALSRRGWLCAHTMSGREQSYILRKERFPDLEWPAVSRPDVGHTLLEAYLSTYAPAAPRDVAHFFGVRLSQARPWFELARARLAPIRCGERQELWALSEDEEDLRKRPPARWAPRLLPKFDTLLMAHHDKTWTVPNPDEHADVWAKAADVRSTVLHRGRVVATWSHKTLGKAVEVTISPLSTWTPGLAEALHHDLDAFAAHHRKESHSLRVLE